MITGPATKAMLDVLPKLIEIFVKENQEFREINAELLAACEAIDRDDVSEEVWRMIQAAVKKARGGAS